MTVTSSINCLSLSLLLRILLAAFSWSSRCSLFFSFVCRVIACRILSMPLYMFLVTVASPLSLGDGVAMLCLLCRFLVVIYLFLHCLLWISSRHCRSRGVSMEIFSSEDFHSFGASFYVLFAWEIPSDSLLENWENIRRISSSWIQLHESAPCCLETENALWYHTLDDIMADTKGYIDS